MQLSELRLYPLKGAAGIAVREWPLDAFGLMHDRRWMVVDADGAFLTQRGDALLGQIRPAIEADSLVLRAAGRECRLPLTPHTGAPCRVRVWQDEVAAIDCGAEAAALVTAQLGRTARVVYMPDTTVRTVDRTHARDGGRVSFADAFPLLIIGEGSLDELNRRLQAPVEMARFRPNIVIAGAAPHAEDGWRVIRIGTIECDVVKPCSRCRVPTIDPATGIAGDEPLRTLGGYRKWNRKVWFGQNSVHRSPGRLAVGDAVTVMETADPEPPLL